VETNRVREILEQVRAGELTPDAALATLRWAPVEELGFARVDTHRPLRTGYPEVVFCQGKPADQVVEIFRRLAERSAVVLATRASAEHAGALRSAFPEILHHEAARVLELRRGEQAEPDPDASYILVVSAGTSDIPVAEEAAVTARALGSRVERLYDVGVAGLHRLLEQRDLLLGASALVVVAGMEGALPSVVAGLVEPPVIAVPTSVGYGANFGGLAALLAMLNSCATGIAVVNIDNGFGAGYFAHLICQTSGDRRQATVETPVVRRQTPGRQEPMLGTDAGFKGGTGSVSVTDSEKAGLDLIATSGSTTKVDGAEPEPSDLSPVACRLSPSEVTVLEANLDDLNPQIYDHVMDRLFAAGALDVTLTPIQMKKNRPAVTLSVICDPAKVEELVEIVFAETSTLGLRMSRWERICLERDWVNAETPWGPVRVKIGRRNGQVLTRTPEYDDCKRVAQAAGVPLKEVQAAALAAVTER
jgi:pyridinium-3,5-biscarboxylic acid mononucleotide synthase